ncbi:MAG: TonB-dependent receptor [Bdellovibrionales bacterium]|nr:TonB-dependent receptor [Bdellovibrionales bacterium]
MKANVIIMSIHKLFFNFCYLFTLLINDALAAPQQIIVESTKINEDEIEPSRSTTILSAKHLSKPGLQTVADALRTIPGVEVIRQGTVGQTTSVFIRGARSEDTLVLIDGIVVNDAISPANGFDFSNLSLTNVSQIEVYKGPQSVEFGAGSLGGVINIITKEGSGAPTLNYKLETSSYATNSATVGSSGSYKNIDYAIGASSLKTDGYSSAAKKYGNYEKDGAHISSFSAKTSYNATPLSKLSFVARYTNAQADIDNKGGSGGDDPNNTTKTKHITAGLSGYRRFLNQQLKSSFGFYYAKTDRNGQNQADSLNATQTSDSFSSENKIFLLNEEFLLGELHTLRGGVSLREESGNSLSDFNGTPTVFAKKNQSVYGANLTYLYESPTWFFDIGTRSDYSSTIGSIQSYRASAGRFFIETETKFYLTYGTGYKLPSLYQLYSVFGDSHIKKEISDTFDFTIEQSFNKHIHSNISIFKNNYKDLIDFDTVSSKYFNISKAKSRGIELQITAQITQPLSLIGNYIYLDTEDSLGKPLLRRPTQSFGVSAELKRNSIKSFIAYRFRGERKDIDPSIFERMENHSYDLVNIGGEYALNRHIHIFSKIENLFNKQYEEVKGYGTAGLSYFFGINGVL